MNGIGLLGCFSIEESFIIVLIASITYYGLFYGCIGARRTASLPPTQMKNVFGLQLSHKTKKNTCKFCYIFKREHIKFEWFSFISYKLKYCIMIYKFLLISQEYNHFDFIFSETVKNRTALFEIVRNWKYSWNIRWVTSLKWKRYISSWKSVSCRSFLRYLSTVYRVGHPHNVMLGIIGYDNRKYTTFR